MMLNVEQCPCRCSPPLMPTRSLKDNNKGQQIYLKVGGAGFDAWLVVIIQVLI